MRRPRRGLASPRPFTANLESEGYVNESFWLNLLPVNLVFWPARETTTDFVTLKFESPSQWNLPRRSQGRRLSFPARLGDEYNIICIKQAINTTIDVRERNQRTFTLQLVNQRVQVNRVKATDSNRTLQDTSLGEKGCERQLAKASWALL